MSTPPSHARPSHTITTPRLILRSAHVNDAIPFSLIRSHALNNPFGGVVNATLPVEEQRKRLAAQAESTAAGKNAWVNVILKPGQDFEVPVEAEELRVEDGVLIGMSGFNCFTVEEGLLVGNTGALIDFRFARKGLAVEVLEAVFEYGFGELGCGKMMLETNSINEPFRALMRSMGLGDVEKPGADEGDGEDSVVYLFGREKWEEAKRILKGRKKWYLD
jgi:RimJ/RimL family protein N-acetyltransferase